ncbi:MAG: EAL domain-containing protein [Veillonellaceae bacterium]|nr:EAL domain-containing protein [Veillonellaceae bacterium]
MQLNEETKLRTLVAAAIDGILILKNNIIIDCNRRILEMFGCRHEEIIGTSPLDWSPARQGEEIYTADQLHKNFAAAHQNQILFFEWVHLRKDGTPFHAEICLYSLDQHRSGHLIAVLKDITEQKNIQSELRSNDQKLKAAHTELISLYQQLAASEEAIGQQMAELTASKKLLEYSEQRYQLALDASNDAIWEIDLASDALSFSAPWLQQFGLPVNEPFPRKLWLNLIHPEDRARVELAYSQHLESMTGQYDLEYRVRSLADTFIWLHARGKLLKDSQGAPTRIIGALTDISDRKQRDEQIYRMAYYDHLTGLPNRNRLEEILQEKGLLQHAEGALLFIDLDDFKWINDSAGHACGDALIGTVAQYLQSAVGPSHILARVGGDEFIVVLAGISQRAFIDTYAQRLIRLFHAPIACRGHHFYLSASIGIALFPENAATLEDLLKKADNALHRAKEIGRSSYCFFEQSMQDSLLMKVAMESRLRASVFAKKHFQMHYQPQMEAKTGRIIGMESLMRWNCPELGEISPLQFIPVAEENGLIIELGDWGLRTACRFCKDLHKRGYKDLSVSVNVSVKQLASNNYVETVAAALVESGLQPDALELEITESVLIGSFDAKINKLNALRAMGIRIALDDFGTGYSSLTYLQQLPIHTLKIDQTFIHRMNKEDSTRTIIDAIIALAHRLGIVVVAEGIETDEQLALLKKFGCDIIQGYHLSAPLPAEKLAEWLDLQRQ